MNTEKLQGVYEAKQNSLGLQCNAICIREQNVWPFLYMPNNLDLFNHYVSSMYVI